MGLLTAGPLRIPPEPSPLADVEQLGERIAELAARISAATYQLLLLIREFDDREGWNCGFRTCAHWLSWRTGLAIGPAREKVRVARALAELPLLSEAMGSGELSYSKVRALTRVATAENEGELLVFARAGTATHVERVVRGWRRVDRIEEREREGRRHASRYFDTYTDDDGMVVIRGRLEPEAGAALIKALEAAEQVLFEEGRESEEKPAERVPMAQRRADAVGRVAEAALDGGLGGSESGGTKADRYQVVVHVEAAVLQDPESPGVSMAEEVGGVPAGTSRRIACDASKVLMTHDERGRILDVGRKTRVISPALRRALTYRDNGCRFPGCGLRFCDAHHVEHWAEGGETRLDNLVLLCRRHHRCVHEEGYRVASAADGEFRFLRPDGREMPEAPPLPDLADSALVGLEEMLIEAGVDLDEMPACPQWDGSALDLAWAVDRLRSVGRGSI